MKYRIALLATVAFAGTAQANDCAAPTSRDNQLSLSGIVNSYYPVRPIGTGIGGYSSSTTVIELGPALSCVGCGTPSPIVAGDMVLVAQFQDPQINSGNSSAYGANNGTGRGVINAVQVARFQFLRVIASSATTAGGSITIRSNEPNGVDFSFGTGLGPGRLLGAQIIKVPQLANVRLGGTVTAPYFQNGTPMNGQLQQAGGIVVLDVAGTLDLNGQTIDVSGRGYRGGGGRQYTGNAAYSSTDYTRLSQATTAGAHGSKGEGIAGTPRWVNNNGTVSDNGALANGGASDGYPTPGSPQAGSVGRGAPGNAGGGGTDNSPVDNSQNTGGGGGAGYGNGGQGGNFGGAGNPGLGGIGVTNAYVSASNQAQNAVGGIWQMAAMGGGGGAGSANNAVGAAAAAASGAAGGGIVIIRANAITGTGTVMANGANATSGPDGDAAGGGGGGGWIVLAAADQSQVTAPSLLLQARGGAGGSTTGTGNNSGPGGGGGGGGIAYTNNLTGVSADVAGGLPGTATGTSTGATGGSAGLATSFPSIYHVGIGKSGADLGTSSQSVGSGAECVPIITKSYTPTVAASGANRTFTVNVKNPNGGTYPRELTFLDLTDNYPTGVANAATPNLSNNGSCGTPAETAAPNQPQFTVTGGNIPGGATCTFTMTVTATGSGTLTNTIAQDAVSARINGITTVNETPAVASLSFPAGVTGAKDSAVVSDPVNGATNPKRIPGATVDYTVTINNASGSVLDNNTMVVSDALPTSVKLFVGNLAGGVPYEFTANASNLSCANCISYSTLASPNVANDADWTYTPVADADGADANVRHIRFKSTGAMAVGSTVTFRYRTLVK